MDIVQKHRILLVEDNGGIIQAVKWVFEDDHRLEFLGYATSKTQIAEFLDEHVPDVVLVDMQLTRPGTGLQPREEVDCHWEGLEIIALIKQTSSVTRVIGFSNYFLDDAKLVKESIRRGADALIAKQEGPADWQAWSDWLRFNIHGVIGGWWRMSPEVARLIEEEEQIRRDEDPNDPLPLTERQMEVLHLMACGMTDAEIARKLHIVDGAVRGHISNIKERMQMRYRWEVIEAARLRGLGKDRPSPA